MMEQIPTGPAIVLAVFTSILFRTGNDGLAWLLIIGGAFVLLSMTFNSGKE